MNSLLKRRSPSPDPQLVSRRAPVRDTAPPVAATPAETLLPGLDLHPGGFVFDPQSGESFTLSESAVLIVEALREGLGHSDILCRLQAHYDTDRHTVARDLDAFLQELSRLRLLITA